MNLDQIKSDVTRIKNELIHRLNAEDNPTTYNLMYEAYIALSDASSSLSEIVIK